MTINLPQLFGSGAMQDATSLTIDLTDLDLTLPATAEAILVAVLLRTSIATNRDILAISKIGTPPNQRVVSAPILVDDEPLYYQQPKDEIYCEFLVNCQTVYQRRRLELVHKCTFTIFTSYA